MTKKLFDYLRSNSGNFSANVLHVAKASSNHSVSSKSSSDNRAKELAFITPSSKDNKNKKGKADNNANSNNNDNSSNNTRTIATRTKNPNEKPNHDKHSKKIHSKALEQTKAVTHKWNVATINHLLGEANIDIPNGRAKGSSIHNFMHNEKHSNHAKSISTSKHTLGTNQSTEHAIPNIKAYQQWRWNHNPHNPHNHNPSISA